MVKYEDGWKCIKFLLFNSLPSRGRRVVFDLPLFAILENGHNAAYYKYFYEFNFNKSVKL